MPGVNRERQRHELFQLHVQVVSDRAQLARFFAIDLAVGAGNAMLPRKLTEFLQNRLLAIEETLAGFDDGCRSLIAATDDGADGADTQADEVREMLDAIVTRVRL
jgi:hypothetical protein